MRDSNYYKRFEYWKIHKKPDISGKLTKEQFIVKLALWSNKALLNERHRKEAGCVMVSTSDRQSGDSIPGQARIIFFEK